MEDYNSKTPTPREGNYGASPEVNPEEAQRAEDTVQRDEDIRQSDREARMRVGRGEGINRRTVLTLSLGGLGITGLLVCGIAGLKYIVKSRGKTGLETVLDSVFPEEQWKLPGQEEILRRVRSRIKNPKNPVFISTYEDLNKIRFNLDGDYVLMNDIDCKGKPNFEPIGSPNKPFGGVFNGNHHIIRNLTINKHGNNHVGFFSYLNSFQSARSDCSGGVVSNLILENIEVKGQDYVGSFAGASYVGGAENCFVDGGRVTGNSCVGGCIGFVVQGKSFLENTSFNGEVIAKKDFGKQIGLLYEE